MATEEQLAALAKNREATQFGKTGGNPRNHDNPNANKTWSIRNQLRRLAAQEVTPGDKEAVMKLLPAKPTLAQLIAANVLIKASKADMRAVEFSDERIDGKLPQVNVNADFERLQAMTDEELEQYNADIIEQINALRAREEEGGLESGDIEPGTGEAPNAKASADVGSAAGAADSGASEQG